MLTKSQRLIISVVAISIGVFLILMQNNFVGWLLILMAVSVMYGYFRYQPVALLVYYVSKERLNRADQVLAEIGDPTALPSDQRADYACALGGLHIQRGHSETAEPLLARAATQGLRTSNDKALVHALLAYSYIRQGDRSKAQSYLSRAKTFEHNTFVADKIRSLEEELASAQV